MVTVLWICYIHAFHFPVSPLYKTVFSSPHSYSIHFTNARANEYLPSFILSLIRSGTSPYLFFHLLWTSKSSRDEHRDTLWAKPTPPIHHPLGTPLPASTLERETFTSLLPLEIFYLFTLGDSTLHVKKGSWLKEAARMSEWKGQRWMKEGMKEQDWMEAIRERNGCFWG